MAFTHLWFDKNSVHGRLQANALSNLEAGLEGLIDTFAVMNEMKDGDGSQAAHFTQVTSRFGYTSDANSKAAYDELNSLQSKLTTNASVSNVNAALLQVFNRFR